MRLLLFLTFLVVGTLSFRCHRFYWTPKKCKVSETKISPIELCGTSFRMKKENGTFIPDGTVFYEKQRTLMEPRSYYAFDSRTGVHAVRFACGRTRGQEEFCSTDFPKLAETLQDDFKNLAKKEERDAYQVALKMLPIVEAKCKEPLRKRKLAESKTTEKVTTAKPQDSTDESASSTSSDVGPPIIPGSAGDSTTAEPQDSTDESASSTSSDVGPPIIPGSAGDSTTAEPQDSTDESVSSTSSDVGPSIIPGSASDSTTAEPQATTENFTQIANAARQVGQPGLVEDSKKKPSSLALTLMSILLILMTLCMAAIAGILFVMIKNK